MHLLHYYILFELAHHPSPFYVHLFIMDPWKRFRSLLLIDVFFLSWVETARNLTLVRNQRSNS